MSEYQYYEFRAIDRPLTKEEMSELRAVSSRGEITSTSYVNEHHYGDFKGNPDQWMERYFDAFVYYANWGSKTFKLRIPESLLSSESVEPYLVESFASTSTQGFSILTFEIYHDDAPPEEWYDSSVLGSLIGLRAELAHGDLRCLYLGWLVKNELEYVDDEYANDDFNLDDLEPPVPSGLRELTASQQCFVEFFEIDPDLLAAAASASPPLAKVKTSADDLTRWIANLTEQEKNACLVRVLDGSGPGISLEMEARFQKETRELGSKSDAPKLRTLRQLKELTQTLRDARVAAKEAREAKAKQRRLEDVANRLPAIWDQVELHFVSKRINEYDKAVVLLKGIQELVQAGGVPDYAARMASIRARYSTKPGLLQRIRSL